MRCISKLRASRLDRRRRTGLQWTHACLSLHCALLLLPGGRIPLPVEVASGTFSRRHHDPGVPSMRGTLSGSVWHRC